MDELADAPDISDERLHQLEQEVSPHLTFEQLNQTSIISSFILPLPFGSI
jgi:hypothetical protein